MVTYNISKPQSENWLTQVIEVLPYVANWSVSQADNLGKHLSSKWVSQKPKS